MVAETPEERLANDKANLEFFRLCQEIEEKLKREHNIDENIMWEKKK